MIAVVAAACLVDATPGASYAGLNGQELGVYSYNAHSIEICGTNQNGKIVCPSFNLAGLGLNNVNGWWWKGTVTVGYYTGKNDTGTYEGAWSADAPSVQLSDYFCVSENYSGGVCCEGDC